jgi:hypothetical protein
MRKLPLLALLALGLFYATARAEADPDCRAAGNIAPGLQKLVDEFHDAGRTGNANLSVRDFLAGVTEIPAADRAALDRRGSVKVASASPDSGSFSSDGQTQLQFEGIFARRQTFFRVPLHIHARYVTKAGGVTLYYDPSAAIELGEAIPLVGIPIFRTINHVSITRDRLLFFWDSNASDDADRCYVPS